MSKQITKTLVPKLRFPEFRDTEEWEQLPIGKKVDFLSGYPFKSSEIAEDPNGIPLMRGINITEGYIRHTRDMDRYYLGETEALEKYRVQANDLVIGMDGSKVGKNSALVTDKDAGALLVQRVARLRTDCNATISFIFQHIHSTIFHSYVDRVNTSGGIPHISAKQINEFEIFFPPVQEEQQKIADCLSSVDELITTQAQKVDALKAHKKGLMQQLFPAEGETVPKLRFPEFQDAGEWVQVDFDELVDVIDGDRGKNYPKADEFSSTGYCVFLNAKNVTKNGFKFEVLQFITKEKGETLRKGKLRREDIVLTTRGSVGQFAYYSEDVPYDNMRINSGMVVLRIKTKKINSNYLYAFSKSERLAAYINNIAFGNAQQQLTVAIIKKFQLQYPEPEEQHKIADCLSSIDELITAQSQKLEDIKSHKKGLMQQLFPAMDEVSV